MSSNGPQTPDFDRSPTFAQQAAPLTWRSRDLRWVLVFAAALLAWSWSLLDGYRLADSVEYMEHARELVRGERVLDKEQLRSFGFTTLLVPLFALGELAGFAREATWLARLLQVGLTLALVAATVRIAARFVPRGSALVAGVLLVAQPSVLAWGVSPVSGIAAGLCVLLALERLLGSASPGTQAAPERRDYLWGGLWLGLALLMAYKTLPLVLPIVGVCALRCGWKGRRQTLTLVAGIAACLLVQAVVDVFYYGHFGRSLWFWAHENVVIQISRLIHNFSPELAQKLYNSSIAVQSVSEEVQAAAELDQTAIRTSTSKLMYLHNIGQALFWPAALLAVLGLVRLLSRLSWTTLMLASVIALDVAALSWKSAKSFRLWLPLFAPLAVAMAIGWDALFLGWRRAWRERARDTRPGWPRAWRALGYLLVGATVAWSVRSLAQQNTRRFAGFWRAAEVVNAYASETRTARAAAQRTSIEDIAPLEFACAWHWAVYLREERDVELVKLPWHLDYWDRYDEQRRAQSAAALAELDVFCVHLPLLQKHPEVFEIVNRLFAVHAVLYEDVGYDDVGPLYVLVRRSAEPDGATFWELTTDLDVATYRERHHLEQPRFAFRKPVRDPDTDALHWQELVLLGYEWRPLEGGYGWLTYHWSGGPFDGEDYTIVDRVESAGPYTWRNDHEPAYGQLPTSTWQAGWILREGYLVVPEERPFAPPEPDGSRRPLGADYLAGDLVPASLWLKVVRRDDSSPPLEVSRLVPYPLNVPQAWGAPAPGPRLAIEELTDPGGSATARGLRIDSGLMARVGHLSLAVPPRFAWPESQSRRADP